MESKPAYPVASALSVTLRSNAALLAMTLIWALNFSIVKDALATIPPLAFNTLRFPLAAGVVTLVLVQRRGPLLPPRADRWKLIGLGMLANVGYQLFFIFGLANTRAGTASLLLAGTPIVTAVVSAALGKERIAHRVWLGVMATVLGIALVVVRPAAPANVSENTGFGNALMIGATLAWALYSVGSRNLIHRYGALPVTTWTLWAGALAISLIGLPSLLATDLGSLGLRAWFAVVYAGAFSIGIAYVLWSFGVKHLGPTLTATYANLVPVLALGAAWLMLAERPTAGQILGATVIIGGVTLSQVRSRPVAAAVSGTPGA